MMGGVGRRGGDVVVGEGEGEDEDEDEGAGGYVGM